MEQEISSKPDTSFARKAKDTAAGFVGGAVQVLVGQPFDLVKVRLQTGQFSTPLEVVTKTLANEGILAFYKGTLAPLFGVGACVSVQFYAFHEAKRQFQLYNKSSSNGLTFPQYYIAGGIAGLANTVISSPVEQLRIILQTQKSTTRNSPSTTPSSSPSLYTGPVDAAKDLIAKRGVPNGLFRGFSVTALREFQAYGIWFLTFEYLMARECSKPDVSRDGIPAWKLMMFGALAGEALWLASYPLDVIKSQVQSAPLDHHLTARQAAISTWKKWGFAGFWRGLVPTLLRAIPASSCTFASVELTMRLLDRF